MLEGILPDDLSSWLNTKINWNFVNEIRLRALKPMIILYSGQKYFFGENGLTSKIVEAFVPTKTMIEDILFRASECSIYSVNEQIKKGFIMTKGGIRIGIGGNMIEEKGIIKTMTNFSSLNIRIPHEIKNCSLKAFNSIYNNGNVQNTLVIAPPGCGKTTFLRDLVYQFSERNLAYNVLVLDERGELDTGEKSLGNFVDTISFSNKMIGFENGIRSLSPDIIVTDELSEREDINAVIYASNCGVKVIASIHASNIEDLAKKENFEKLIERNVFKRYIVLSNKDGPGSLEGIYNEKLARCQLVY